ncbi:hypothetical protein MHYP_G00020130 [Metynnis hypsauchen]
MGVRAQASIKGPLCFVCGAYVGLVTRRDGEAPGDQLEHHGDGQRWHPRPSILQARQDFRNKPVVLGGRRKSSDSVDSHLPCDPSHITNKYELREKVKVCQWRQSLLQFALNGAFEVALEIKRTAQKRNSDNSSFEQRR